MRTSTINRKTAETDISLTLNLDGSGISAIDSGCGFLDHMLTLFARHGGFDLTLTCKGDTYVDDHHTVEDIGICLGKAIAEALGDKRGIRRYGDRTHAIKNIDGNACEAKRLYIKPEFRGKGYARELINAMLSRSKELGFHEVTFTTKPEVMGIGYGLYQRMGFKETDNRDGVVSMKMSL